MVDAEEKKEGEEWELKGSMMCSALNMDMSVGIEYQKDT